jgi:hypothetical protein
MGKVVGTWALVCMSAPVKVALGQSVVTEFVPIIYYFCATISSDSSSLGVLLSQLKLHAQPEVLCCTNHFIVLPLLMNLLAFHFFATTLLLHCWPGLVGAPGFLTRPLSAHDCDVSDYRPESTECCLEGTSGRAQMLQGGILTKKRSLHCVARVGRVRVRGLSRQDGGEGVASPIHEALGLEVLAQP